ncbi:MAG TPA: co-chaperone DjlA [Rhodanobacteraceae bacterium]|nr:co-chaperone DjlA [Rhodanobacteraceae bacterium]
MNRHWGAIIGALLGAVLFRSFWAGLIGALAGNFVDNARGRARRQQQVSDRGFVDPLFALIGAVAKSDGRVSEREIAVAESIMQRLQLDNGDRKRAVDAFNRGKQASFQAATAIRELKDWTRGYRDLAFPIVDVVADAVLADGTPTPGKLAVLKQLAWALRISELELMAMLAMKGAAAQQRSGGYRQQAPGGQGRAAPPPPPRGGDDPYAVLGLPGNADNATIKRTYRKLISEHHPDRLGNLPEDLRRRAEQRASSINAAYDRIKELRGL